MPAAPVAPPPQPAAPAPVTITQYYAPDPTEYVFTDPDRTKKLASAFPAIDKLGQEAVTIHSVPGVSIGVVVDGQLVYANGFGVADGQARVPPDQDTQYRLGSLTKSFTALAVLSLRDQGVLSLDDPLARWLPEAAGLVYPTRDAAPITLRQVLTHTSGLPRDGQFRRNREPSEQEIVASLQGLELENPPGAVYV
jgi:CubicO group peptidase (beta-lactamase class C family)